MFNIELDTLIIKTIYYEYMQDCIAITCLAILQHVLFCSVPSNQYRVEVVVAIVRALHPNPSEPAVVMVTVH
jgi:hypothetical protein